MNAADREFAARPAQGFTLLELLVAMTVLAILVVLVNQLVSSATSIAVGNRQHLDADGQARVVFDRMAFDFAAMLKRPDVDYVFSKYDGTNGGGNDKMFFYSEAPGYFDGPTPDPDNPSSSATPMSSVALVGYRINAAFQLERLGKTLTWSGATAAATPGGIMFLNAGTIAGNPAAGATPYPSPDPSTLPGNWPATLGSPTDSPFPYSAVTDAVDYHTLASQVFRLEFCFQLTDGTYSAVPICPVTTTVNGVAPVNNLSATSPPTTTADANAGYAAGSRWYNQTDNRAYVCTNSNPGAAAWSPLGLQDISAIVVAIAVLDQASATLAPATPVVMTGGQTMTVPDLSGAINTLSDASISDALTGHGSTEMTVPNLVRPTTAGAAQTPGRLMAEAWSRRIIQPDFAIASKLTRTAAAQVRVYQRTFVLNNQP